MQPSEVLQSYLGVLRRLTGAESISLFLPVPAQNGATQPLLVHDGPAAPTPELASIDATCALDIDSEPSCVEAGEPLARVMPSRDPACRLLELPPVELMRKGAEATAPLVPGRRRGDHLRSRLQPVWIGLRFGCEPPPLLRDHQSIELSVAGPAQVGAQRPASGSWLDLFAFGAALSAHLRQLREILGDPVTGLPGRYELQGRLAAAVLSAREQGSPLSLLLIGPDGFSSVNERFGRDIGDRVIRAIAARLRRTLRSSDLVAKYGGAIFACMLEGADEEGTVLVAEKIARMLSTEPYLDGALGLGFSVGAATCVPGDGDPATAIELVRRADLALNRAKREGSGRFAVWRRELDGDAQQSPGELSGVFTGNLAKDYRNMALLTEITAAVAGSSSADELAGRALEALATTLQADRVAVFEAPSLAPDNGDGERERRESPEARLLKGFCRTNGETGAELVLPEDAFGLAATAGAGASVLHRRECKGEGGQPRAVFVVPLVVGGDCVGSLFLDGREDSLRLDGSDHAFLRTLGAQLGAAIDRARLNQIENERKQLEEERLRAEIEDLQQALRLAKLEYRSREMEMLLATVRRVAGTDATVLISGESGTGKELLVRTLHRLSPRRGGPLVVVDCAAIPTDRIEVELFGRQGGGYSGSEPGRVGRLVEADGGTVLLDEVGDLPHEVQTKLLRFVQDRLVTPVGARGQLPVNVRVVAATHHDLAAEVRHGRFREDLYYRLNVVRLHIPPLRDRPDDILHLAEHFVATFALLYHKPVRRLAADAEAALLRHSWPGNVRELENQIQQAVILSDGEELGVHDLGLIDSGTVVAESAEEDGPSPPLAPGELWTRLRASLARHVEIATRRGRPAAPLGRWLGDDLVLEADAAARGVASRAAAALGIPETTFRRRRGKAAADVEAGLAPRPTSWQDVRSILSSLVRSPRPSGEDLVSKSQSLLLEEVLDQVPGDVKTGSRLLGVTPPTFRRRAALLRADGEPAGGDLSPD